MGDLIQDENTSGKQSFSKLDDRGKKHVMMTSHLDVKLMDARGRT